MESKSFDVKPLDLADRIQAEAFIYLLDHYARGDSGGGAPLGEDVKRSLPECLLHWPGFVGHVAWASWQPAGLINCFTGFSTFKARPLLNVHDVVVHRDFRGRGVARQLFAAAEQAARQRGCCKMTLEVLANNAPAIAAYGSFGFRPYELDPAMGAALFYEKQL